MDSTLILVLAFLATFFTGLALGFVMGITKGMTLGARFRSGRPPSSFPWVMCLIASGIFLLAAVGTAIHSAYFLARSVQTGATVTEIAERKDDEGRVTRTTTYAYRDGAGTSFTGESSLGDDRSADVGDPLPVRYLEDSPGNSRIDGFLHHWVMPIFLAVLSLVAGGFGFGLRWWRGREQRWADRKLLAAGMGAGCGADGQRKPKCGGSRGTY